MIFRRRRERRIRECLATFPESIAYPSQVAGRLGLRYDLVASDMQRMAAKGKGIHNLKHTREVPGYWEEN